MVEPVPALPQAQDDEEEEEDDVADDFLATWPYTSRIAGSRVVIVGGEAMGDIRDKVAARFGLAKLEWVEGAISRRVQSLVTSLESGKVDMVILINRCIGHNTSDVVLAACKRGNVPVCYTRGSGPGAIRVALESYFATEDRLAAAS